MLAAQAVVSHRMASIAPSDKLLRVIYILFFTLFLWKQREPRTSRVLRSHNRQNKRNGLSAFRSEQWKKKGNKEKELKEEVSFWHSLLLHSLHARFSDRPGLRTLINMFSCRKSITIGQRRVSWSRLRENAMLLVRLWRARSLKMIFPCRRRRRRRRLMHKNEI